MIYKSDSIPNSFNKIAEFSDNYIVFVEEAELKSDTKYEAYFQYLKPSVFTVFVDDYQITKGTSYTYDYNYSNNGFYDYVDSVDLEYSLNTMTSDDFTSLQGTRADSIDILLGHVLICICILWVFKQFSRLFFKGGLY